MNAPLYNTQILRLAASIPHHDRLANPMASVEKRSPVCGSRVTVDVNVDAEGRVQEIGMLVRACALGQASASLMGAHVIGRSASELSAARDELAAWLAGERAALPAWPYLAPPAGYEFDDADRLERRTKDLARNPVWTGGQLLWVEGKVFSDGIDNASASTSHPMRTLAVARSGSARRVT